MASARIIACHAVCSWAFLAAAAGCSASAERTGSPGPNDGGITESADSTASTSDGSIGRAGGGGSAGTPDASRALGPGDAGVGCAASPQIYGDLKPLWSKTLGQGYVAAVASDSASDVVVAGSVLGSVTIDGQAYPVAPSGSSTLGPFVFELDAAGQLLWHREFGGTGNVAATAVDSAGDVFVAGDIGQFASTPLDLGTGVLKGTLFLAKLDPKGKTLWARSPQCGMVSGESIAVDSAGDVAVVGNAAIPTCFGGSPLDDDAAAPAATEQGFVAVLDPSGNPKYSRIIGNGATAPVARFDAAGNLFIADSWSANPGAVAPSSYRGTVAFALKIDSGGQVLWQVNDGSYSAASALAGTATGVVLAGTTSGAIGLQQQVAARGGSDVFLAGLDESGAPTFEKSIAATGVQVDALAIDPTGGFVSAARLSSYVDFGNGLLAPPGFALVKFDGSGAALFSARFAVAPYTSLLSESLTLAVDTGGDVVLGGAFHVAADLGTGILPSSDPTLNIISPTLFVARYAPQAPQLAPPRAACPVPVPDAGLPEGGTLVGTTVNVGSDLALSADSVYWTTGSEVLRAPVVGGDVVPLATALNGSGPLVLDSDTLYWTNVGGAYPSGPPATGSVVAMSVDGGAITTLASGQDVPGALAVDAARVYYYAGGSLGADGGASPASILAVPRAGGAATPIANGLLSQGPLAVSGGLLAFAMGGSQILTVPTTGGSPRLLATSDHRVASIGLDSTNVYWLDESTSGVDTTAADGRVRSVPLRGGAATVLADMQAEPKTLVVLGSTLFWSASGTSSDFGSLGDAALWSLPVNGGTPTGLVTQRVGIGAFAVDATHLAWFDLLDGNSDVSGLFVMAR